MAAKSINLKRKSMSTTMADRTGKWREVFAMFDQNLDGRVSYEELGNKMRSLGFNATDSEVGDLLKEWDRDQKGSLTLVEFTEMMTRRKSKKNEDSCEELMELKAAFDMFDRDKNGYLDNEEVLIGLRLMGEKVTEEDVAYIMKEADTDGDGVVSFREFCQIVKDLNTSPSSPFFFKDKAKSLAKPKTIIEYDTTDM